MMKGVRGEKSSRTFNRRMVVPDGEGFWIPRVYQRKARGRESARLLIKCGDCDRSVEIWYDDEGATLEIGGVHASVWQWRELLFPLLKPKRRRKRVPSPRR
jgi:hypothetical protein